MPLKRTELGVVYNGNHTEMLAGMAQLPDAKDVLGTSEMVTFIGLLKNGDSVYALVQISNGSVKGRSMVFPGPFMGALQDRLIFIDKKGIDHVVVPYSEINRVDVSCGWFVDSIAFYSNDQNAFGHLTRVGTIHSVMKSASRQFGSWFNSDEQRAQRRKAMREKAGEREKTLDFDSAIQIWEELGNIEEAGRVRKLKAEMGAAKTEIHGDYIDDRDTIVKDSVISKSSIGAGGDGDDLTAKLQQLAQMHRDGILSDEQFEAAKNKLLN